MAFKDVLLHLSSYPDPIPEAAIAPAFALCAQLTREVTALTFEVRIPVHSNRLAEAAIGLNAMAREEEARSRQSVAALLKAAAAQVEPGGATLLQRRETAHLYDLAGRVAELARTYDVCVVPLSAPPGGQREVAEAAIFGAGRPVIVLPARPSARPQLKVVAIAWDGSRAAARALADALPILAAAREVRVVAVVDDKPSLGPEAGGDVRRHLARHGIACLYDEARRRQGGIGKTLAAYVAEHEVDLLVMGAYGRSRVQEFVLGGATESLLEQPPCPILLSH